MRRHCIPRTRSGILGTPHRLALLASVLSAAVACSESKPRVLNSTEVHAKPGPGDSLAKLTRKMLEAEDPVLAMQDYMCEIDRLIQVYGPREATEIQEIVEDTTYKPEDEPARRRVEQALAHRVLQTDCTDD